MDSVPLVAITGQQTRPLIGTDAFQEADITGITMPVTKHNMLVTDATEIPRAIAEAFHLASTGRPGPVLVDIPKDVLQEQTTFSWPPELQLPGYRPTTRPHGKQIREAARLIRESAKPVLYVGGGVLKAEAAEELRELAELTGAPVVTTLMARGVFPDSHPLHLGMPGMHGTVAAVAAMQRADLLVALGSRFDDRVTGSWRASPPRRRSSTPTSTRPRSPRTGAPTCRSSGTARRSWPTWSRPSVPTAPSTASRTCRPGGSRSAGCATATRSATTSRPTVRCPRST